MANAVVDFALAPDLSWGHLIRGLQADLESALSPLAETLDRANGAFWFSHILDWKEHTTKTRECYLRAGLAEFTSMQDTLERDLQKAGIHEPVLKIRECLQPEVHIIQYLRNLELHLQTSQIVSGKVNAVAGDHEMELTTWYVSDLDVERVAAARNARWYSPGDLRRLTAWFNEAQKKWGVDEILRRAVIAYSEQIVERYSLKPASAV